MQVLYWFESIRNPVLDSIMLALTEFGGETAFLVAALICYWCIDKRNGYYLMAVGFVGTVANQFLKIACQIPRPWVRDPNFTIVEAAREGAGGYSFPSGHSQTSVGTFGAIALTAEKKWVRYAALFVAVIVPITRMYLGVHTPADVLVGSGMALALLILFRPLVFGAGGKYIPAMFLCMSALAVAFVAYAELFPFPADIDPHNLASCQKNAYTLLGTMIGMTVVYFYDEKKLHFSTDATAAGQIAKILGGLAVVLLVKEGMRAPLDAIFGGHLIGRSVRYLLIVLVAGMLWPMAFPRLSELGKKAPN